jgi:flagellar basal-body rod modification protein FlgD
MTPGINSYSSSSGSTNDTQKSSATTSSAGGAVNKDMFMQLLVAQLRNQDPLHPSDGTQFVAQLAQFQQLEESINTGQDIAAMRQDVSGLLKVFSDTQS